jgi:nitrogen fixation/metabolism regulation signal transduction histidine kinase
VRKNNWLSYFVYAVALICFIMLSDKILVYVTKQSERTFNTLPSVLWSSVIFVILGLLLGLEKFLLERRKQGTWKVNLPKVLFLGIPSLYFSIGIFISYCPIDFIRKILAYQISFLLKSDMNFIKAFQVVLGFTISTSFVKEKSDHNH